MGTELFHSELAGHFIVTLGFICPFLYLDTTLSSILQGLGTVSYTHLVSCVFLVTGADLSEGRTPSINAAVLGLTVGEIFSMLIALVCPVSYTHLLSLPYVFFHPGMYR